MDSSTESLPSRCWTCWTVSVKVADVLFEVTSPPSDRDRMRVTDSELVANVDWPEPSRCPGPTLLAPSEGHCAGWRARASAAAALTVAVKVNRLAKHGVVAERNSPLWLVLALFNGLA